MMIPAVITTFPRQINGQPYKYRETTFDSLRRAGFTEIFTSMGQGNPRVDWATAALIGMQCPIEHSHVLIVQDDITLTSSIYPFLEELTERWPRDVGCLSLYTGDKYLMDAKSPGFKAPDANTWGACALLLPVEALRRLVTSDKYLRYPGKKDIDQAIGHALADWESWGYEFWYLFPSAVQHVGHVSTLCDSPAAGWRQASSYRGEHASCDIWKSLWS